MNTSIDIIKRVKAMNAAQLRELHAATGVPEPTLAKIKYGVTKDPRGSTIDALRAYLTYAKHAA